MYNIINRWQRILYSLRNLVNIAKINTKSQILTRTRLGSNNNRALPRPQIRFHYTKIQHLLHLTIDKLQLYSIVSSQLVTHRLTIRVNQINTERGTQAAAHTITRRPVHPAFSICQQIEKLVLYALRILSNQTFSYSFTQAPKIINPLLFQLDTIS